MHNEVRYELIREIRGVVVFFSPSRAQKNKKRRRFHGLSRISSRHAPRLPQVVAVHEQSGRRKARSLMRLMNLMCRTGVVMTISFLLLTAVGVCATQTVAPAAGAGVFKPIRINAGATEPYTDPDGNTWLPDTGFTGGEILDRGSISVANTKLQGVYRTEH